MENKSINVLFTSAGRRVELIRAFRDAYKESELKGHIIAVDADPLAPSLQEADRPYVVPRLESTDYFPNLVDICLREHVDLIFPLIDPDIPLLARNRKEIEGTGARLSVVSPEAAAITADKWLTTQFFQRMGLATPRSCLPGEFELSDYNYPLFIKPRSGSASKHAFKVNTAQELMFFQSYVPDPIIQEYIAEPEITNDVICHLDGRVLSVVSRQRIEVRWGEVAKGITVYDPAITAACVKIAQALPAVGPITVQCMMKHGVPCFTEINARLGGGAPLSIAAGVNFPKWLLALFADLPVEIPSLGSYKIGIRMTRFDDSFFLAESEYERISGNRL